jgi:hypothetical protein
MILVPDRAASIFAVHLFATLAGKLKPLQGMTAMLGKNKRPPAESMPMAARRRNTGQHQSLHPLSRSGSLAKGPILF